MINFQLKLHNLPFMLILFLLRCCLALGYPSIASVFQYCFGHNILSFSIDYLIFSSSHSSLVRYFSIPVYLYFLVLDKTAITHFYVSFRQIMTFSQYDACIYEVTGFNCLNILISVLFQKEALELDYHLCSICG